LLDAVTEGNVPEVGPVFHAINEVADQGNEALDRATSEEEMVAIVDEFNHFAEMMQRLLRKRGKKAKTDVPKH
jgi:hypothetical protein